MRIRNGYRHRAALATAGAVIALGAAACGGGSDAPPARPAPPAPAGEQQGAPDAGPDTARLEELTSCFEENGVPLPEAGAMPGGTPPDGPPEGAPAGGGAPDPDRAPPGVDQQAWEAAVEACGDLAPAPPREAPAP